MSRLARVSGASARCEVLPGWLMLVATPASEGANTASLRLWINWSTSARPPLRVKLSMPELPLRNSCWASAWSGCEGSPG
ncbi:hypothetical protein D3C81_1963480 [compost metagenome]